MRKDVQRCSLLGANLQEYLFVLLRLSIVWCETETILVYKTASKCAVLNKARSFDALCTQHGILPGTDT